MDTLPNEILLDIFPHFSQRYVVTICSTVCKKWNKLIIQPWLFSTIHIYSEQQLKKVIQLVKERKIINHKPIGYYVECLTFHYYYTPKVYDVNNLFEFPNLRHIDGLDNEYYSAQLYKPVYLRLNQPTEFSYYPQDDDWVTKFNNVKHNLKSLNIYISKELGNFIPQQQQLETVHMKSIGRNLDIQEIPIKMLNIPTSLANLTKLKIEFFCDACVARNNPPNYIIDQHTFENIHQSCPLLESLSVEDFFMDISDKYYNNNKNNIIPAHHLKSITIISRFCGPHCFSYLATKYPHLESLSLYLCFYSTTDEWKKRFQNAILNMLLQLSSLKNLSYKEKYFYEFFPYYEFVKWLNLHSNQLTHLEYKHPLTLNKSKELAKISDIDINNGDIVSLPIQQQFNFLNHLTSLSIVLDNIMDLAFTFLSENTNTMIVSTTLEELKIEYSTTCMTRHIYIYDWLDIFPNMLLFSIRDGRHILDNSDFINDYVYDKGFEDDIFYKLHQLIKKRKQQHDVSNKMNEDYSTYKLVSLKISSKRIWFENGFDDLLKKCYQLKKLELYYIIFINPTSTPNETHLDLSHLYIELLSMNFISLSSMNDFENNHLKKLIIHENLTDHERVIEKDEPRNGNQQFSLNLKCAFIDEFTFNFHG